MLVYKFKILLEDNDNFLREIEIKPSQTFEDFYNSIIDCVRIEPGEMASFFICDSKWRKQQEITLYKMDDDDDINDQSHPKILVMGETTLKECIDNPNERLIFIYDFLKMHTFYIELFKIYDCDEKVDFPRCLKRIGDIPKALSRKANPNEEFLDDDEPVSEFEDEFAEGQISDEDDGIFDDFFEESNSSEKN